jgi:hypothetical protein
MGNRAEDVCWRRTWNVKIHRWRIRDFPRGSLLNSGIVDLSETDRDRRTALRYNLLVPDTKPFRLTESVKAAG